MDPQTIEEVKKAINGLKNCKSAGKDKIPVDLLNHLEYQSIHRELLKIWKDNKMPADWLDGLICPIYKQEHRLNCANYKGAEFGVQNSFTHPF